VYRIWNNSPNKVPSEFLGSESWIKSEPILKKILTLWPAWILAKSKLNINKKNQIAVEI